MLLPLAISRMGSAAEIGLVMAAISLGGMLAPCGGALPMSTACIASS
jgi:hypothetical protein